MSAAEEESAPLCPGCGKPTNGDGGFRRVLDGAGRAYHQRCLEVAQESSGDAVPVMARLKMREREVLPRVLPLGWSESNIAAGRMYEAFGFRVIASVNKQRDGRAWLHVSLSRKDRIPSWEELRGVKDLFIGPHRSALQVLPSADKYVNLHPYCLHLWCCLDGDPVPDFSFDGLI